MKMKKQVLSILLSLALMLGLMPGMSLTAYADGDEVSFVKASEIADIANITPCTKDEAQAWWSANYDTLKAESVSLGDEGFLWILYSTYNDGANYNYYRLETVNGSTNTYNSDSDTQFPSGVTNSVLSEGLSYGDIIYYATAAAVDNSVAEVNGTKYETLPDAISAAQAGDTVKLLADVEVTSEVYINKSLTLDLNGFGITGKNITTAYPVLYLYNINSSFTVTLTDSNPTNTSGGENRPEGVAGGYITGNSKGPGLDLNANATLIMNAGTITGNASGVWVSGKFTMNGGTISGNHAGGSSTAAYNNGGGVRSASGKVTINGGVISNNTATANGGGVYSGSTLTITGGTITDNTAGGLGGGVYTTSSPNLSGNPVIKNNKVGTVNSNVYLGKSGAYQRLLNITGNLTNTEPIGISMAELGVFTSGLKNRGTADSFTSDDSAYSVVLDNSGNAKLVGHVHDFTYALATVNSTNDSITATCGASGCDLTGAVTLTLTPTTKTAPESAPAGTIILVNPADYQATLTGLAAFNEATALGIQQSSVKYYNTENGAKTGEALTAVPTKAGTYCAEITVDGKTASIIYTIEAPKYEGMPTQVLAGVTDTTITINSPAQSGEKYEYQIQPYESGAASEWTKTPKFESLNPHTKYYVRARMTQHPDDTVVETTRTTYYTTTITGTAKVGQTLTAVVTDLTPVENYDFLWYVGTIDSPLHGNPYNITETYVAGNNGQVINVVGKQARLVVTTKSGTVVGEALSDPIAAKDTLTAADFTYTPPENLVYNDEGKAATVTCTKQDVGEITVEYWIGTNETYSTTAPTDTGTYTVKISIDETDNYSKVDHFTQEGWTFTITPAAIQPTVTIEGWTVSEEAKTPNVTGNDGNGNVTYTYKKKDAEDSTYSETVPTDAGEYTVKATIAATRNYQAGEATADFKIAARPSGGDGVTDPVQNVVNKINDLPLNPTSKDVDAVKAARDAYDKLTDEQKKDKRLTDEIMKKLTDAEKAIASVEDKKAADAATELIKAIPSEVTEKDVDTVRKAQDAYNNLTDAQKALISDTDKAALENAVKAIRIYQLGEDGTALGRGASFEAAEAAILGMTSDADPAGSKIVPLKLKSTKQTKKTVTTKWTKQTDAVKYVIYGNKCGKTNKMKKLAVTTKTSMKVKKVAGKKLKKGTYYKFIVVALDKDNNVVSTSKVIHVSTKGAKKKANYTKLIIKAPKGSKVTLKAGKTAKIKAVQKKAKTTKVKKHVGLRYESSNTGVAKVSKKGVITGVSTGTCRVAVYNQNGLIKTVKVTVK